MTTVTGLTADAMNAIANDMIVGAAVDGSGHLILTQQDGSTIDAGVVKGSDGAPGAPGTPGTNPGIQDEGTAVTIRPNLNFVGAGVVAADDAPNARTNVSVPGYTDAQVKAAIAALSADVPDKIAWESPAGTDLVELYGLKTAAGLTQTFFDDFVTDTRSSYVQLSSVAAAWNAGGYLSSNGSGGANYAYVSAGQVDDQSRVRVRGQIPLNPNFETDFAPGFSTTLADQTHIMRAEFGNNGHLVLRFGSGSGDIDIGGPVASFGNWYTVELTRSGNNITTKVFNAAGAQIFTDTRTLSGTNATLYGAGKMLYPTMFMGYNNSDSRVSWIDSFEIDQIQPERHDLMCAITPAGGARTVKRLLGSYGPAAFKTDLIQTDDLAVESFHIVGGSGEPAFQNSWVNYDIARTPAQFYKDRKRVFMRGLITGPALNQTIFTLPPGYRPSGGNVVGNNINLPIATNSGIGILSVLGTGDVQLQSGSLTWADLAGVSFYQSL